jgi:hypothetical protein
MPLPITSKYIGVTTVGGHIARAIDFSTRDDVWVTLGKRNAWTGNDPLRVGNPPVSDSFPPLPNPLTLRASMDEPLVAKKAILQLVVPDAAGGLTAYGQKWRPVDAIEAMAVGCRWVYLETSFDYNEAPVSYADSYLIRAHLSTENVLDVFNAGGYMIGDELLIGPDPVPNPVTGVNTTTNVVTVRDPLGFNMPAGTYVANPDRGPVFTFRQAGVITHATTTIAPSAPGQRMIPYSFITDGLLEYIYNATPIPRALNSRSYVRLVLTF